MPLKKKPNTKVVKPRASKKTKKRRSVALSSKIKIPKHKEFEDSVLSASSIGIDPEYLAAPVRLPVAQTLPATKNFSIEESASSKMKMMRRSLVAPRTSFWLGVGFGIFVTGVLGYLVLKLYTVELAQALVLGWGV